MINKRLKTLGIPFVIWSAFGLAVLYVLELFPYTRNLLASSHIAQIDGTRIYISQYHWYELLARWLVVPVSYQLWFLQVLLVYNLAYPLLSWCVLHKTGRWIFFTIALFLWLTTFGGVLIDGEGLVFFSLGIWMQKNNFNIESPSWKLSPVAWGALFVLLCSGKTWLAFNPTATAPVNAWFLMILMHKFGQFAGLAAVWFGCNALAAWCMARRWFEWLSGFSFIIYVIHAPAAPVFIDGVFAWLHYAPGYRMISFIILPLLAITICIITGATLRRIAPQFYGLITGGRGFA